MKVTTLKNITLLGFMLLSLAVMAADSDKQFLLTESTYKALSAAQQKMEAEQYAAAEKALQALLQQTEQGSYDQAIVLQTIGYLYAAQENYLQAAKSFQQALDSKALPDKVSHNLRYNLAQLLLADEQYKAGIALMETWLAAEKSPPNSAHVLLASAYYRTANYKKVVEHMNIAIKNDKSPKEDWYRLILSAHMELKQYKSAINVLEILITQYPYQKVYWDQLGALYLQQNKEFTMLAVRVLAEKLELGDARTLSSLVDMYRYLQIPYKAADLLSRAMDQGVLDADFENLQRLADSWLAAKEPEKAVEVLQRMVSLDETGETDLKLGRVYIGLEHWQQAEAPLTSSISKLKGDKQGTAMLLLGMVYFNLHQLDKAKTWFGKALAFENEQKQAAQWLRHLEDVTAEQQDAST